ncbi:MAG: HDOD domain-containing protein [Myxococcota bacterium]
MFDWLKKKMTDPNATMAEALAKTELQSFPAVVREAMVALRNPKLNANGVAAILAKDPGFSVRLLRLANSAAYTVRHPVRTVTHAVALLGRREVESLLLAATVPNLLPKSEHFNRQEFWRTAAFRATTARALAQRYYPNIAEESFTSALLQDMAIPLLAATQPETYAPLLVQAQQTEVPLLELERERLGYDHTQIGGCLCALWSLPDGIARSISSHHDEPHHDGTDAGDLSAPLPIYFVASLDHGVSPDPTPIIDRAEHTLEVGRDEVRQLVEEAFHLAESLSSTLSSG